MGVQTTRGVTVLFGLIAVLAGCSSPGRTPEPIAPPAPPAPAVVLPMATESGCSAFAARPTCQAFSTPQPATLPWREVMAVASQQQAGRNVGAAYLCAAVDDARLHTLFGPSAVRAQDGPRCLLSSSESLDWITAERGTVTAETALDPAPATAHTGPQVSARQQSGRMIAREPDHDAADVSHRAGWVDLPGTGRSVRVEVTYTWPTPGPQPTGAETRPDPAAVERVWHDVADALIQRSSP